MARLYPTRPLPWGKLTPRPAAPAGELSPCRPVHTRTSFDELQLPMPSASERLRADPERPPPMRIAQVAPLAEAVPPKLYGGTERVVSFLTEELVAQGHDVTLFASGDSRTSARLEALWPRALRLDPSVRDSTALHTVLLEHVFRRAGEFDVLHFHMDYVPFPLFSRQRTPFVTTLHGRLDL